MPREWIPVPIGTRLFLNVREEVLSRGLAALENVWVNEAEGHSGMPPVRLIHDFGRPIDLYLADWRGNLVIVDQLGRMYRMARNHRVEDVTEIAVSGGKRAIFAKTESGLVVTAGQRIISLFGELTDVLSPNAPLSSHVAFLDGYLIAIENESGRFYHSRPGLYREWHPLNVFSAEGTPDNLTSAQVTPYRELVLGGLDSIEQFESYPDGNRPFFRRWSSGEGVLAPYTLTHADNASWVVNGEAEFVRFSVQTGTPVSGDVGKVLEAVDDWAGAWAKPLHIRGQKLVILQIPKARSPYGGAGITFLFDYRSSRWSTLYGWDEKRAAPELWPISDAHVMREWGKLIFAGEGKIYETVVDDEPYGAFHSVGVGNDLLTRQLCRTGHIDEWGECRIDNLRMRLRRGFVPPTADDSYNWISLRSNRDRRSFGPSITKALGASGDTYPVIEFGQLGSGHTHQFEYQTFQPGLEVIGMDVQVTPLGT